MSRNGTVLYEDIPKNIVSCRPLDILLVYLIFSLFQRYFCLYKVYYIWQPAGHETNIFKGGMTRILFLRVKKTLKHQNILTKKWHVIWSFPRATLLV